MSVYQNLNSIKRLNGASLSSIVDITNLNFSKLSGRPLACRLRALQRSPNKRYRSPTLIRCLAVERALANTDSNISATSPISSTPQEERSVESLRWLLLMAKQILRKVSCKRKRRLIAVSESLPKATDRQSQQPYPNLWPNTMRAIPAKK